MKTLGPQTNKPLSLILHCDLISSCCSVSISTPVKSRVRHRLLRPYTIACTIESRGRLILHRGTFPSHIPPFPPPDSTGFSTGQPNWGPSLLAKADQKEACQVPDFVTGYLPSQKEALSRNTSPVSGSTRIHTYLHNHLHQHTPPSLIYPTSSLSTYVYGKALSCSSLPYFFTPPLHPIPVHQTSLPGLRQTRH